VTVPELGLSRHRICRDHVLIFPPLLPVRGQWEGADGRVARFSFAPRFIEAVSSEVGLPTRGLSVFGTLFFRSTTGSKRCAGFNGRNRKPVPSRAIVLWRAGPCLGSGRAEHRPRSTPGRAAALGRAGGHPPRLSKPGNRFCARPFPGRACRPSPAEPRPFRAGFSAADRPRAAPIPAAGAPEPRAPNVGARKRGHVAERNRGGVRLF